MDAEREAREAARPRDIPGCGSPAYVFGFDAGWAARSEWCRADQTRADAEWLRGCARRWPEDTPQRFLLMSLAADLDREFPSVERSGQAPSEQEEHDE